jgi:LysM repeat protein
MRYIYLLFLLAGCSARVATETASKNETVLEEVRVALLDIRQAYGTQQIDIQNLEQKVNELKPNAQIKTSNLEARLHQLEKQLANIQSDLHSLSIHANQTTESLLQYRNQITALDNQNKNQNARLDEVANLKTTLNSISQAIGSGSSKNVTIHKVVSGDSLEKIARHYGTTIDTLKKTNGLTSNTIIIGQELKIPE